MKIRKKSRQIGCVLIGLIIIFITTGIVFSQVRHQRVGGTKRNAVGGYDFFNAYGKRIGYSKRDSRGGYSFYDSQGNKIGALKRSDKSKRAYNYYDAEGIKRGVLRKRASGIFYYKDMDSDKMIDSIPEVRGDPGSLMPGTFRRR